MRMKIEPSIVGVQHAHRAGGCAQLGVVVAEGVERVPGALQQQRVHHPLVVPGQAAQLGGQREGDHEVGGRHQRLQLTLQPDLTFVVLAVRAGAVAAGVGYAALLDHSLKRSANGRPPGPGRWYAVHSHRPGPDVLPSSPA